MNDLDRMSQFLMAPKKERSKLASQDLHGFLSGRAPGGTPVTFAIHGAQFYSELTKKAEPIEKTAFGLSPEQRAAEQRKALMGGREGIRQVLEKKRARAAEGGIFGRIAGSSVKGLEKDLAGFDAALGKTAGAILDHPFETRHSQEALNARLSNEPSANMIDAPAQTEETPVDRMKLLLRGLADKSETVKEAAPGAGSPFAIAEKRADMQIGPADGKIISGGIFIGTSGDQQARSAELQKLMMKHRGLQATRKAYAQLHPEDFTTIAVRTMQEPGMGSRLKSMFGNDRAREDRELWEKRKDTPAMFLTVGEAGAPEQYQFYDEVAAATHERERGMIGPNTSYLEIGGAKAGPPPLDKKAAPFGMQGIDALFPATAAILAGTAVGLQSRKMRNQILDELRSKGMSDIEAREALMGMRAEFQDSEVDPSFRDKLQRFKAQGALEMAQHPLGAAAAAATAPAIMALPIGVALRNAITLT